MGFPQSFPRAIAYVPKEYGGIGLHLCGIDQGLHKVLQMIKHTRTKTSIRQVYNIVTLHYQLMSRLSSLILQDTQPILWSTALWYDNLRQFLHSINGQIILQNPWIPIWQQHNDCHIMDNILGLKLPCQHTIQLQSVCLFLQVSVLSEITHHTGLTLLPMATTRPHLRYKYDCSEHDYSTLQWLQQTLPRPMAWKRWSEMISWLYLNPNTSILNQPLGQWLPNFDMDYKWYWHICPQQHVLFRLYSDTTWYAYHPHQWYLNHITYLNRPSITTKPSKMVPVTPTQTTQHIHILLPIHNIIQPNPPMLTIAPLLQSLTTPRELWEEPLWNKI